MKQAVVALGSNLGDRFGYLQHAVQEIGKNPEITIDEISSVYETEAIGGPENQEDYLNAVMVVSTTLSPEELLQALHDIENQAGRVRTSHHGPRTLDLDLIDYEGFTSTALDLVVPHPRAHERAFVLIPLAEIAPEWKLNGEVLSQDLLDSVTSQAITLYADLQLSSDQL